MDPTPTRAMPPPLPTQCPPAKRWMLSWWGLLPVILYVALQYVFGWPVAKAEADRPDYAVSRFMGMVIGGPLFGLIVAWIAYHFSRKSQGTATITFTVVMLIACASAVRPSSGLQTTTHPPASVPQSDSSALRVFLYQGFSVTPPAGWREEESVSFGTAAKWLRSESPAKSSSGIITIETTYVKSGAKDYALKLAKEWGAHVLDEPTTLDGEAAWRIQAEPRVGEFMPTHAVVAFRKGAQFTLVGGNKQGDPACDEAVETLRGSWRWTPADSPVNHLDFCAKPTNFLDGKLSVNFPASMTPHRTGDPKKVGLSIYNFKKGGTDFGVQLELMVLPAGDTLQDARNRLREGMKPPKLGEPMEWRSVETGDVERAITQDLSIPSTNGAESLIFAMVGKDASTCAYLFFTIGDVEPSERTAYIKAAEAILRSIQLRPAAAAESQ